MMEEGIINMRDKIKDKIIESIQVKEELMRSCINEIIQISACIIEVLKRGGKVIFFGNGGSAADCQHLAAELVGRFQRDRRALPAVALTTDSSILTSLANDYGYEVIFAKQIEALGNKGDVAVGISTSGRAKNVVAGIKKAKEMNLKTVALTGCDGGAAIKAADLSLIVPSKITARIQEAHITIGHIICELAEEALCG